MHIGAFALANNLFVAPMAGVTDRPFRQLCRRLGAGHAVSEMISARPELRDSLKTSRRANHEGESAPITVQIAGTDAAMMAEAARYNIDRGAQIIDINMGCPAKKVCNRWAGSALMRDEPLALDIVEAVVAACAPRNVPVTLKMRTGWCDSERNALRIARAAQDAGVALVVVHGRTREQGYKGLAEYDTVAAVKAALRIPVVANGDIDSPQKALQVLQHTGCDALMIGRAAMGRPWIFREIAHHLRHGSPGTRAGHARGASLAAGASARPLHAVRRAPRRAHRAQAHRLGGACTARRRGLPRGHEHARLQRRAGARGVHLLRGPGAGPPAAAPGRRASGQRCRAGAQSMSTPGRPKGEFRSAQHEGTPVSPARLPDGASCRLARRARTRTVRRTFLAWRCAGRRTQRGLQGPAAVPGVHP